MTQFAKWLHPVCLRCGTQMRLVRTMTGDIHCPSLPIATFQCRCGNAIAIPWESADDGKIVSLHDNSPLRYFLAVCEHGSFTAAAIYCGVSQPAVTGGVARLEKALGGKLFFRKQPVVLTPFGAQVRPYVELIQSAGEEIRRLSQARALSAFHANNS